MIFPLVAPALIAGTISEPPPAPAPALLVDLLKAAAQNSRADGFYDCRDDEDDKDFSHVYKSW